MVRRYNRLLVAFYVLSDALLAAWAFLLAYVIRFECGLIPVTKGTRRSSSICRCCPSWRCWCRSPSTSRGSIACAAAARESTTSSRVLVGSILAVVFGVGSPRCISRPTTPPKPEQDRGAYQVSQIVWALFLVLNVASPMARASSCASCSSGGGARASV